MKTVIKIFASLLVIMGWSQFAIAQSIESIDLVDRVASVDSSNSDKESTKEPSALWLSGDLSIGSLSSSGSSSFLGTSEIGGKNWSISATLLQSEDESIAGLPQDSSYINFDVKRRLFGSQGKSNLKLGLGWQELDIDSQLDASGPKVSLSGQYKLFRSFQIYGATSYFPELEDDALNTDLKAYELEAGLLYKPLPSISLKAGYRIFELDDLSNSNLEDIGSTSGFLFGTDLSW